VALITIKVERTPRAFDAMLGWRRRRQIMVAGIAIGALVSAFFVSTGLAQASVVSIPPRTIASDITVPSYAGVQLVAAGGSTAVPTGATRVVLSVSLSGATSNGKVGAYPTGSPSLGSGTLLSYAAGDTVAATFTERVGLWNKVTFVNHGTGAISATVKVVGYSTDVRASDISPYDGAAGQVLTNTGSGAAWQFAGHAYGIANAFTTPALTTSATTVASVTVPSGSYVVTFSSTIAGTSASTDNVGCYLLSPANDQLSAGYGNTNANNDQSVITMQGLVNTSGGTIIVQCVDSDATATAVYPTLIANSVGTVNGFSGAARAHVKRIRAVPSSGHQ
jgi:hypothetical protein